MVTGPMIRDTVEVARAVKKWDPDFPIILGGWHPSLLPGRRWKPHTWTSSFALRARTACWKWLDACRTAATLEEILGIGFKRDGKLHMNPERPLKTLDKMPQKAYQLADFDAYERVCGRRWTMYVSSLACPFNCSYCTNAGVYGRKWNALPVEQVVEETIELTRRYRLELLWMADDNFLVDLTAIAQDCRSN